MRWLYTTFLQLFWSETVHRDHAKQLAILLRPPQLIPSLIGVVLTSIEIFVGRYIVVSCFSFRNPYQPPEAVIMDAQRHWRLAPHRT